MKYKVLSKIGGNSSMKLLYGYMLDLGVKEFMSSYRKIGKEIGLTKGAVGRNMRKLRDNGVIKIESRYSEDGARLSNKFILH